MDLNTFLLLLLLSTFVRCEAAEDFSTILEVRSTYPDSEIHSPYSSPDSSPSEVLYDYPDLKTESFKAFKRNVHTSAFQEETQNNGDVFTIQENPLLKSVNRSKGIFRKSRGEENHFDKTKLLREYYFWRKFQPLTTIQTATRNKITPMQKSGGKSLMVVPRNFFPEKDKVEKLNKRAKCCPNESGGLCLKCYKSAFENSVTPSEQLADFAKIPLAVVNFTSEFSKNKDICRNIDSELIKVNFRDQVKLSPQWLHKVHYLGMCPYTLQKRSLGSNTVPSHVVEIQCLCKDAKCSQYGGDFRCTPVKYTISTSIQHHKSGTFGLDLQEITAGCVCAQRPSSFADNGNKYFVGDSNIFK